jgi:hypothetical protein
MPRRACDRVSSDWPRAIIAMSSSLQDSALPKSDWRVVNLSTNYSKMSFRITSLPSRRIHSPPELGYQWSLVN